MRKKERPNGILSDVDSLDIEDFIMKIESEFQIRFFGKDIHISTFGDLTDYITEKINFKKEISQKKCTSQVLFYRFRKAIQENGISEEVITPKTKLTDIFKFKNRKDNVRKIEEELGLYADSLKSPKVFIIVFFILFIILVANFYFDYLSTSNAIYGWIIWVSLFFLFNPLTIFFKDKNVGQLIKRIQRENYLSSQNSLIEFKKEEVENAVKHMLIKEFSLEKVKINRTTILF